MASDTRLRMEIEGNEVADGAIDVRRLGDFMLHLQSAVDRIAFNLDTMHGFKVARAKDRLDTKLRLAALDRGSLVPTLTLPKSSLLGSQFNVPLEALVALVDGIGTIGASAEPFLPKGFDSFVVRQLREASSILKHDVSKVTLRLNGSVPERSAPVDPPLVTKLDALDEAPVEEIVGAEGHLLYVNFAPDSNICRLYIGKRLRKNDPSGYLSCTFDDDLVETIRASLRRHVFAVGIATVNPDTGKHESLHIKKLMLLDVDHAPDQKAREVEVALYRQEWGTEGFVADAIEDLARGRIKSGSLSDLWSDLDAE